MYSRAGRANTRTSTSLEQSLGVEQSERVTIKRRCVNKLKAVMYKIYTRVQIFHAGYMCKSQLYFKSLKLLQKLVSSYEHNTK